MNSTENEVAKNELFEDETSENMWTESMDNCRKREKKFLKLLLSLKKYI